MGTPECPALLRIGELSRRLGVSDHVLRAWESRYGLLQPARSAGGFRLYSEADELRVPRMQAHLARGLSAAEAARAVLGEDGPDSRPDAPGPRRPGRHRAETLEPLATQLTAPARRAPLALAGPGATPQIASAVGARLLTGDPVTEAESAARPR